MFAKRLDDEDYMNMVRDVVKHHQTNVVSERPESLTKPISVLKEDAMFSDSMIRRFDETMFVNKPSSHLDGLPVFTPEQRRVGFAMNPLGLRKSILLFHSLGAGKTNTALHVAAVVGARKTHLLSYSTSTKANFFDNIYKYENLDRTHGYVRNSPLGEEYLNDVGVSVNQIVDPTNHRNATSRNMITNQKLTKKLESLFKDEKGFIHSGFTKFANDVRTKSDTAIKAAYSNTLIIIDEAHHLNKKATPAEEGVTGGAVDGADNLNLYTALIKIVSLAENVRLVALSATPMFDTYEIINNFTTLFMLNEGYSLNEVPTIELDQDEKGDCVLSKSKEEFLLYFSHMFVSYVNNPPNAAFPRQLPPNLVPLVGSYEWFKGKHRDHDGGGADLSLTPLKLSQVTPDGLDELQLVLAPMAGRQLHHYLAVKECSTSCEQLRIKRSDIVYPAKDLSSLKHTEKLGSLMSKQMKRTSYYRAADYTTDWASFPFTPNNLREVSSKLANVIDLVQRQDGRILIYTRFVEDSVIPIMMALECIGYKRFSSSYANNILDFSGVEGRPQDYPSEDGLGYALKYIVVTGEADLSPPNANLEELRVCTSSTNLKQCKVIIITKKGAEGLDCKGIEHVHVFKPWYNFSLISQVVGRAVRMNSHKAIEDKSRHEVRVYLHAAVALGPDGKLIHSHDTHWYGESLKKLKAVKVVTDVLKRGAMDCGFDTEVGRSVKFEGKVPSKAATPTEPGYLAWNTEECECALVNKKKLNVEFSARIYASEIKLVASIIKREVSVAGIVRRQSIADFIFGKGEATKAGERLIDAAIDYIINEPILLYNKFGVRGHLATKLFADHNDPDRQIQTLLFVGENTHNANATTKERMVQRKMMYRTIDAVLNAPSAQIAEESESIKDEAVDTNVEADEAPATETSHSKGSSLLDFDEYKRLLLNKGMLEAMSTELLSGAFPNPPEHVGWIMALEKSFTMWKDLFIQFNVHHSEVPPAVFKALRRHQCITLDADDYITEYYEIVKDPSAKKYGGMASCMWLFDRFGSTPTKVDLSKDDWLESVGYRSYKDVDEAVKKQGDIKWIPAKFCGATVNGNTEFKTQMPNTETSKNGPPTFSYLGIPTSTSSGPDKLVVNGTQFTSSSPSLKTLVAGLLEVLAVYSGGVYNPRPISLEEDPFKKFPMFEDGYKVYRHGMLLDTAKYAPRPITDIINEGKMSELLISLITRIAQHEDGKCRKPYRLKPKPHVAILQKELDYYTNPSFPSEEKSVAFHMILYYLIAIDEMSAQEGAKHNANMLYLSIHQLICLRHIPNIVPANERSKFIRVQN